VTYFPCPLKQGNESFNLYSNSVSQFSSLYAGIICLMSEKTGHFLQQGIQLHKKILKLYR